MHRLLVRLTAAQSEIPFLSVNLRDYWNQIAADDPTTLTLGVDADPVGSGPVWVIDGLFPSLSLNNLQKYTHTVRLITASNTPIGIYLPEGSSQSVGEVLAGAVKTEHIVQIVSVDQPGGLALAERTLRSAHAAQLEQSGVYFVDVTRMTIDPSVTIAPGARIWPEVTLLGRTVVSEEAEIQSGCWVEDTHIGKKSYILTNSVCRNAWIGDRVTVGPMAHLRPGSRLESQVKIGNFVEINRTTVRKGAKANHLTYLGDADVGENANIGAGTITCNYNGFQKQHTIIEEGAFIGSNSSLIAPVRVGRAAMVAAGSVVTRHVGDDELAIARPALKIMSGRARMINERNRAISLKTNPDNQDNDS